MILPIQHNKYAFLKSFKFCKPIKSLKILYTKNSCIKEILVLLKQLNARFILKPLKLFLKWLNSFWHQHLKPKMAFIFHVSRHTKLLFDGLTKNLLFFLYDRHLIIFYQFLFFQFIEKNCLGYQQGVLELKLLSQLIHNIIIDKNISKRVW